jgi:hypothetical protein
MNVFLVGGGTRLAAHLGALKAIEEQRGPVGAWAGASAGSLIAAVRAAGFSHGMAVDLMLETHYRQFFDVRPLEIFRGYGLCSGKRLEKWLNVVLRGIRFKDLPQPPIDDSTLFPAGTERALTIRMVRDRKSQPMRAGFGWAAYIQRIASLLLDAGDDWQSAATLSPTSLTIRTGHHSAVDFDLSPREKKELYELGYDQATTYLRGQHGMRRPALERLLHEVDENLIRLNDLAYTA